MRNPFKKQSPEPAPGPGPDYSNVGSLEAAQQLATAGELVPMHLMPLDWGGVDAPFNVVYVPPFALELKQRMDDNTVRPLIEAGKVRSYAANARYDGDSFIPVAIEIHATDPGDFTFTLKIWGSALAD